MKAGLLRQRVVIQAAALAAGTSTGDQPQAWSDVETVYARVRQIGGVETWKQKAVLPEASWEVTIRYTANLTPSKRLKWGTKYLYPLDVVVDEKNRQMVALCREELADT